MKERPLSQKHFALRTLLIKARMLQKKEDKRQLGIDFPFSVIPLFPISLPLRDS